VIIQQVSTAESEGELSVQAAKLSAMSPDIVFAFGHPRFFEAGALPALKQRWFPAAHLLGCSSAGEISGRGVTIGALSLTAVRFDKAVQTRMGWAEIDDGNTEAAGRRLGQRLAGPDLANVLVFGPGVEVDGSALIRGLRSSLGETVCITGGLAGDDDAFCRTFCMGDHNVSDRGMVALGFYGSSVTVRHGCYGGWQPFGATRQVTRRDGNVLLELDGRPALDVYRRYLGTHADGLPATGLLFPFAIVSEDSSDERQDSGLIRSIISIDEPRGGLVFAGDIPIGCRLRLMQAKTDSLVNGAQVAAERALCGNGPHPELALLVSCVGRRLVMAGRVDEEVEAVADAFGAGTAIAGFYSFGEISPFQASADCHLHNQTMTITTLAES
jgi:hypothetical protein